MLSKSQARAFFLGFTVLFSGVFLALTVPAFAAADGRLGACAAAVPARAGATASVAARPTAARVERLVVVIFIR